MLDIAEYASYEEVHHLWQGLNARYKGGELALDWKIHHDIWRDFHAGKGTRLRILAGFEAGVCVGIIPLAYLPDLADGKGAWILGEEAIIAREYFCPPDRLHAFLPFLPRHECTDLSCFYQPRDRTGFIARPGCIIDLKDTEEAYLASIGEKQRADYLKTLRMNEDIEMVVEQTVKEEVIGALRAKYTDFWMRKVDYVVTSDDDDSRVKLAIDFALLCRAAEMGNLVALHFFENGRLVAANFAVRREGNRVDDYACIRDTDKAYVRRRLGVLAIIRNMQVCRSLGVRYYDLSDFRAPYKEAFINTESHYLMPHFAASTAPPD